MKKILVFLILTIFLFSCDEKQYPIRGKWKIVNYETSFEDIKPLNYNIEDNNIYFNFKSNYKLIVIIENESDTIKKFIIYDEIDNKSIIIEDSTDLFLDSYINYEIKNIDESDLKIKRKTYSSEIEIIEFKRQ